MKLILVITLLFISSASTFADEKTQYLPNDQESVDEQTLVPMAESEVQRFQLVDSLLQYGYQQIAGISLKQLRKEIETLRFFRNNSDPLVGYPNNRNSAVYFKESRTIVVNSQVIQNVKSDAVSNLLVHEMLGALGYPDVDYMFSSLFIISNNLGKLAFKDNPLLQDSRRLKLYNNRLRNWKAYLDSLNLVTWAGGSTVTGGGGTTAGMLYKFSVLQSLISYSSTLEILDHYKLANAGIIRSILELKVEVDFEHKYTDQAVSLKKMNGAWYLWIPEKLDLKYMDHLVFPNDPDYIVETLLLPTFLKAKK